MKTSKTPEQMNGMVHKHYATFLSGDGATVEFDLGGTVGRIEDVIVFVNRQLMRPQVAATANDYAIRGLSSGYDGDKNRIKFTAAPGAGQNIDILRIGG